MSAAASADDSMKAVERAACSVQHAAAGAPLATFSACVAFPSPHMTSLLPAIKQESCCPLARLHTDHTATYVRCMSLLQLCFYSLIVGNSCSVGTDRFGDIRSRPSLSRRVGNAGPSRLRQGYTSTHPGQRSILVSCSPTEHNPTSPAQQP